MLVGFAVLMAFNQVVIKVSTGGFQPVFLAGLRSLGAIVLLLIWILVRKRDAARHMLGYWRSGLLIGAFFTVEFLCLFIALDLTSVAHASILLYSMPVWLALIAHVALPQERLSRRRVIGLILAMCGVTLALLDPVSRAESSLLGDLAALIAAFCWAGIAISVRLTKISKAAPETQLMWQLVVSAIVLILVSPLFGPLLRGVEWIHIAGLVFQITAVASFGFLFWFWLLTRYPASGVASFSFLSPVFGVLLGWLVLGEQIGIVVLLALVLVAAGLVLINRRAR